MTTKTMKYEIVKPLTCDWKEFGQTLRDVRHDSFRVKNRVIQMYYQYENERLAHKVLHGSYPDDKDVYGKPFRTHVYQVISAEFTTMVTTNLTSTIQKAAKAWKTSRVDVLNGRKSIPSFRLNNPIELNATNIRKIAITGKRSAELEISLLSQKGAAERGGMTSFRMVINPGDGGAYSILKRVADGEYKLCGSMIVRNERKRKWMLSLTYQFESLPKALDENRILGIDLGIVNAVYMAVNDNKFWRERIDGGEIEQFRKRVDGRRRSLAKQAAYCGESRIGHGRKKRMAPVDQIGDKISRFRDTVNHAYSRRIVEMAIRMDCGVIQMEDLSGIDEDSVFLKNWTYADLQIKIMYKAAEHGIEVRKIQPKYTSQRCSECGHIDHDNRPTQEKFSCVMCGFTTNADFNAARNIATPNIEEIIQEKCKSLDMQNVLASAVSG